jgi:hypothetical protein
MSCIQLPNSLSHPSPSFKKELASKIKVFSTNSKFVFWFKVSRDIFNLDEDVIFGIVYVLPVNTTYSSNAALAEIEAE